MPALESLHIPSSPAHHHPSPTSHKMGLFSLRKKSTSSTVARSPSTSSTSSPKHTLNPFSSRPTSTSSRASSPISPSLTPSNMTSSGTTPTRRPPPPEAPPAYQPPTTTATRRPLPAEAPPAYQPPITTTADNRYAFLSTFDTIFLIDDSGSMAGRSWRETAAALASITPICTEYDADGVDLYFLNHPDSPQHKNLTRATDIESIFQRVRPMGGTPTGSKLNSILKPYLKDVETKGAEAVKPLNIIVITDGVASDDVESVIINAAKKLDKWDAPGWQVGIQFFQVGNEEGAAQALRELDDDLAEIGGEDLRDMVDTVPWSGGSGEGLNAEGILKVVLGAVHRKLDRKRNSAEWRR